MDTFLTRTEAEIALRGVVEDEPDWADHVYIERFELVVADPLREG